MHKKNLLFAIRGYVFILALLLYLISMVFPSEGISILLNITSIGLFLTAVIGGGRFYTLMALFLLLCSIVLIELRGMSLLHMVEGFSSMVKLILFIGTIPLVSFPVGGYVNDIKRMMDFLSQKISSAKLSHYASFLLANVINLAAIPISKILFFQDGLARNKQLINAELTGRSYGLAMMCTPIGAAIAVAIDITGTKWLSLLSVNLILVIVGLWLSYQLGKKKIKAAYVETEERQTEMEKPNYLRLLQVFIPFCLYFLFLLVADGMFTIGIMELIILSVLPFTLLWSLFLKIIRDWWLTFKSQVFNDTPKSFGQYAVIISAGLMIHVLEVTGLDVELIQLLPGSGSADAAYFYIPITIIIILFLSMIGVHQFVGMLFAGKLISPDIFGIDHTILSSALLVGFVVGMFASTFSGANILMANLVPGLSSYEIGRKNYLFTILFICFSSLILIGLNSYFMNA
jgi:hypothetical protein